MRNRLILLLINIFASCILLSAQEVHSYELNVGDFDRLVVDDGINVEYYSSEDSVGIAKYVASKAVADHLIFDSSKEGRLLIQKAFHGDGELTDSLPTVKVYSRFLTRVQNNGDSTVTVARVASTPEFKGTVIGNGTLIIRDIHCTRFSGSIKTGNGQLVVTGVCDKATYNNTGVGNIQADGLKCNEASCRYFGTGTTGVWVLDTLIIKGMFPGKLYYKGDPKKIKNYSMGVKLYPIDANGVIHEPEGE